MSNDARATLEVSREGRLFLELVDKLQDAQLASAFIAAGCKLYTANGKENVASMSTIDLTAALVSLKSLSFINPRGKFDLAFTKEALCISNAKSSVVVPTSVITHVAILDQIPQDSKKRCLLFIVLDRHGPAVMSGKQRLDAVIVQTLESDTLNVTSSGGEPLEGPAVAVLCQALGMSMPNFTNFIAPDPDVYRSAKGHNAVPAIVKVSPGLLFPLGGALLFAERPALFLPHADVLAVEFRRPQSATFDLVLHVRGVRAAGAAEGGSEVVQQVEFSQVDSGELGRLRNYFAASKIQPYDPANPPRLGAGPSAAGGVADTEAGDADGDGDDDDDDDEEDEDFDPSALQRAEDGARPSKRARTGPSGSGAGGSGAGPSGSRDVAMRDSARAAAGEEGEDDEDDEEDSEGEEGADGGDDDESEASADSYDEEDELADLTDEDDLAAEAVRQRVRGGGGGKGGRGGSGSRRPADSEEEEDFDDDDEE